MRGLRSNFVKTSRVKLSAIEAEAFESSPILEEEQATTFRSGTMRCAYLSQDRVDISEAIKCLARTMSKPKAGHMTQLKRLARYLKGEPSRARLEVHVDIDWTGDTVTLRSTSGDCAARTTLAQTQLNSTKRHWTQ